MINQDFGGCPHCGANDGHFNIRRVHWAVCEKHKTKWQMGINLFPTCLNENQETWEKNAEKFSEYEKVIPIFNPLVLVVKPNCAGFRVNCPICGNSHKMATPYWIFFNNETFGICLDCAMELDPILLDVVTAANGNHRRKEVEPPF
jgi:hypothetical protein